MLDRASLINGKSIRPATGSSDAISKARGKTETEAWRKRERERKQLLR